MKVLLTRPAADSARIARAWRRLGAECLIWPLTRIVPVVEHVDIPAGIEALLFTSGNAVQGFALLSAVRDLPVLAVGDRTAATAREAGFGSVVSARGNARDLARLARASRYRRFLHPCGRDAAADFAEMLGAPGVSVVAIPLYAAEPAGPPPAEVARAFAARGFDLVTVWSPRNAGVLNGWMAEAAPPLGNTDLLAISEKAAVPLREAGFRRVAVAARPDAGAMTGWISAALRK